MLCYIALRVEADRGPHHDKPRGILPMSAITQTTGTIPAGTYNSVPAHSGAEFAVKTFRGSFSEFDAVLTASENGEAHLDGTVKADSIVVKDENLAGHLK